MNTVKNTISLLLIITMILLTSFSAMASAHQIEPKNTSASGAEIQPFYVNISTTSLSRGSTWAYADMETYSKLSLRIDIKIYKNGSLDFSDYATASNSSYCLLDVDYDFISGVSYKIDVTYKAGTESVPKSMSFTQK